ncbi:MAG TPA: Nif3-like dinuclear metal center hexameric protein [Opitutaceae bacterium]|nr:Nif3-like dinuclear metal center hexameric protein [Opitutaceae bacterium]
MAVALQALVAHCNERLSIPGFPDYPGALNGLQAANNGTVTRIGAAVDAGLEPFGKARDAGVDFLIVHHGMFWDAPRPLTGAMRERVKLLLDANIALYSAHLPLDAHPEIGNNALLVRELGMEPARAFYEFEGRKVGAIARHSGTRSTLRAKLEALFPGGVIALEFGSAEPREVAVITGGGYGVGGELAAEGVDTFITGELKQHWFNRAQEERLNVYACGHYATETFGVRALASELSAKFGLPWEFIATECPL